MPGFRAEARWSLVGSFGLPEWLGRGAREINQAGLALHVAPLTKPPEEGTESRGGGEGGKEESRTARGTARPPISSGSTGGANVPAFKRGRAFLISRQ